VSSMTRTVTIVAGRYAEALIGFGHRHVGGGTRLGSDQPIGLLAPVTVSANIPAGGLSAGGPRLTPNTSGGVNYRSVPVGAGEIRGWPPIRSTRRR
jgi:hypothetical protein